LSVLEIPVNDRRDRLHYPLHETAFHRIVQLVLAYLFKPFVDLEVESSQNLPRMGGVIIAANHLSDFDIFPLQLAIPRPLFYMGKAELFQNPILHAVFRALGAFPIYRGAHDEWALLHAQRILEANQVLGIFPEGTRSHGSGLKVAKTGAARLALKTSCPIVPVAIHGSQSLFRQFPRRTRVQVRICEPVWAERNELPLGLTDRVMLALARNLPVELRGVYAEIPSGF
jgi:1-acyl-sn-glycerol-3-phosphate acyltransferase